MLGRGLWMPPLLAILHSYVEADPVPIQAARFMQKNVSVYNVVHNNVIGHWKSKKSKSIVNLQNPHPLAPAS
jgi:hypothetical protein